LLGLYFFIIVLKKIKGISGILLGELAINIGNIWIFPGIMAFNDDTRAMWELCNCPDYKMQYTFSQSFYFYTNIIVIGLGFLELIPSIWFCCKRSSLVIPVN